jgi:hypothetical protein
MSSYSGKIKELIRTFRDLENDIQTDKDNEGREIKVAPTLQKTRESLGKLFGDTYNTEDEKLMAAVIAIYTLMRRREWLRLSGEENPEDYIMEIYRDLTGIESKGDKYTELQEIFASENADELWRLLAKIHRKEVHLFFWEELAIANSENQSHNSFITLEKILDHFKEELRVRDLPHLVKEPFPKRDDSSKRERGYDEYCDELHARLRKPIDLPDLVLLDTIDLANYYDKGLILPISLYNQEIRDSKSIIINSLCKSPQSKDLLAIPLIPNWHEAAICNYFLITEYDSENEYIRKIFRIFDTLNKSKNTHLKLPDLIGIISLDKMQENWDNQRGPADKSMGGILSDMAWQRKIPIVPMQAASGAHVVYTFFSYMSNISGLQSFIKVESSPTNKFKLSQSQTSEDALIKRAELFLKVAFCFAPIDILCFDHLRSAALRDVYPYWFDPCLPREAIFFQKTPENWPIYLRVSKDYNNYLTCLGGYCLAMLSNTRDRSSVASMATDLRNHVYRQLYNLYPTDQSKLFDRNLFNGKLLEILSSSSLGTPDPVAIRPFFPHWRKLEETISNVVRMHLFTLLMARDTWSSAERYIAWNAVSVERFVNQTKEEIKKWVYQKLGTWGDNVWNDKVLNAQFDFFSVYSSMISGILLNNNLPGTQASNAGSNLETEIGDAIKKVATQLIKSLIKNIDNLCHRENWEYEKPISTLSDQNATY